MRIPLSYTISYRYLPGFRSGNAVNILSRISIIGMGTGAFALIVVLSVFNGFEGLVTRLYHSFYPDLLCVPVSGKTFIPPPHWKKQISALEGVSAYAEVWEEQAYFEYGEQSYLGIVKGVSPDYVKVNPIDTFVHEGKFLTGSSTQSQAVVGSVIAQALGISVDAPFEWLTITIPTKNQGQSFQPDAAFRSVVMPVSGIFSVQQESDSRYVFTDKQTMQTISLRPDEITALEIKLNPGADAEEVRQHIQRISGEGFVVKTRFEQREFVYRMMKIERWVVVAILSFILLVISFNIVGSLSMLMMEKKKDTYILSAMGMTQPAIRSIFLSTGIFQGLVGAFWGLLLGGLLCLAQQRWGFITMGGPENAFVVTAYPVELHVVDFFVVAAIVISISWLAARLPVRRILGQKFSLK